jgi:hypothetical protein
MQLREATRLEMGAVRRGQRGSVDTKGKRRGELLHVRCAEPGCNRCVACHKEHASGKSAFRFCAKHELW